MTPFLIVVHLDVLDDIHRGHRGLSKLPLECPAGVLAAPVRVVQHNRRRFSAEPTPSLARLSQYPLSSGI